MINNKRICSRNKCIEGELNPKGDIIKWTYKKQNGDYYAYCDYCRDNNKGLKARSRIHNKNYPSPDKTIYALYKNNIVVYIGESWRTPERLSEHFSQNPINSALFMRGDINLFSYKILINAKKESDKWRKWHERELIKLHQPEYNKEWK